MHGSIYVVWINVETHLYVECHNVFEPANPGQGEVIIG